MRSFLLAILAGALLLAFAAYISNPVKEAVDVVRDITTQLCPSGWTDSSSDVHNAPVKSCTRGNWVVVLTREGAFSHAIELNRPGAEIIYRDERGYYVKRGEERVYGFEVPDWK